MTVEKVFPEGMKPLDNEPFTFRCHPGVACFTVCCRNVDLDLYPYDIIRLKRRLGFDSRTFLQNHTALVRGDNPHFPTVKLLLTDLNTEPACPFLTEQGCRVYDDRPTACRTYPLERAVDRSPNLRRLRDWYFLKKHPYCLGHQEPQENVLRQWIRNQRLEPYNLMNDLWAQVDSLFATNPFKGEGAGGPKQQLSFLACYNIDDFRSYAEQQHLFQRYPVDRDRRRRIARSDEELLKFAFEWLLHVLS
ncbi:YkgJ family cysteine cluster protein [Desulfofustis limnaeus]|uniref:Zinc/iron-chelating domain-containing protein n=1 Tax=Desulfofustis limnaeus TaxID=2740163 RepID=A0ABM7W5H1_9BACT|nr:YkgJ family cysteine cluster protein [Desulfofustis limnaeus]MDX9895772.1 YkgJ family cysteine cluster protein [Desulfofustis sp.]BDD86159.1 zinc/iron-chelating domain-containing protein [Desulfofustis limnaeus]